VRVKILIPFLVSITDSVQAVGQVEISVRDLGVDLLSMVHYWISLSPEAIND